jgi:hypothetical protein
VRSAPLGPRARRRLAWLAGTAAAVVVVGGGAIRLFDSAGSGSLAPEPAQAVGEQDAGVAFGAKPGQVLQKLGAPSNKHSDCWVYTARAHRVGGAYLGKLVDGLKYCFGPGPPEGKVVTNVYEHVVAHTLPSKKWFPGGWEPAIAIAPGRT